MSFPNKSNDSINSSRSVPEDCCCYDQCYDPSGFYPCLPQSDSQAENSFPVTCCQSSSSCNCGPDCCCNNQPLFTCSNERSSKKVNFLKERCSLPPLNCFPNPYRRPSKKIPAWMTHCGKILRFYAYYQEPVPESNLENYRVHQCEIRYYLVDATISVYEPKTFDPGFPQGCIIRRQKIPMPAPARGTFTLDDLDVGCTITLYGKTFFITGVDGLTRNYLNRQEGRSVHQNMEMPTDPYTVWREDRIQSHFAKKANINLAQGKAERFLEHEGRVLRFWAYWDNRCNNDGELKQYLFHYFLQDEMVEIREITDPEGHIRGSIPFLGKGKLYKNHKDLVPIVGIREDAILILNTSGGYHSQMEPTALTDKLCPGVEEKEYVTDMDLAIGAVINVYGRAFILTDCDPATQTYYREKYGIEDFTPLVLEKGEEKVDLVKMEVPPYNGFGDEEDTYQNWDKIQPTPPKKNEIARLLNDKDILVFQARFDNALNKVNQERRFVIKIYMMDNTMQIFEKPHPNSGLKPGQFLARSTVRKRFNPAFERGEESEFYDTVDYYIGNTLDVNGFRFLLICADDTTLSYMENNSNLFPQSNLCLVVEKVKEAAGPLEGEELLQLFTQNDSCLNGVIGPEEFKAVIRFLTKDSLSEHEHKTLRRGFKIEAPNPPPDWKTLQSVVQTELLRKRFDHYLLSRIEYTLRQYDPCRTGFVDQGTLRSTLRGAKIPLDKKLVDFIVDNFPVVDHCNRVNYCEVMRFFDYIKNCAPAAKPTNINCVLKWIEPTPPKGKVYCVNYGALLKIICPTLVCALGSYLCPPEEECPEDEEQCPQEQCFQFNYDYPCESEEEEEYWRERERAERVISDQEVTPEDVRCEDEDCGDRCGEEISYYFTDPPPLPQNGMDAFNPCENECSSLDYKPGNYIGYEELYGQ